MKIAGRSVAGMLRDPSPFAGVLLYGEDGGLVRERASLLVKSALGGAADPFRSAVLLREEHGRLREEVSSLALGGGRRVVRVQEATDSLAPVLQSLVAYASTALIILAAAALPPRSKLRVLAETHPAWAAVACYAETGGALTTQIRQVLTAAGLSVDASALEFLTEELSDTVRRASELEKLVLYVGPSGVVDYDAAVACCTMQVTASLTGAVSAALTGDLALCDRLLGELEKEGVTGQGLLAVLAMQVHRLMKVRAIIAAGQTAEEACRSLIPPVYPRQLPAMLQEVQRWTTPGLRQLGHSLRDADIACKTAGSRDFAIAAQLLVTVASGVRPPAARAAR